MLAECQSIAGFVPAGRLAQLQSADQCRMRKPERLHNVRWPGWPMHSHPRPDQGLKTANEVG